MKFYTYIHYKSDTKEPFYIGKGTSNRAWKLSGRNKYWKHIAQKHEFDVEIVSRWEYEQDALNHEIQLIAYYKNLGHKLANLTNGGEGLSGLKFSDEHINNLKKSHIGNKLTDSAKAKLVKYLRTHKNKPFICIETGLKFEALHDSAKWLKKNGKPKAHISAIGNALNKRLKSAYGYHWQYI